MDVLFSYENPLNITAKNFSNKIHPTDIHTMDDLISVHRENQYDLICKKMKKLVKFIYYLSNIVHVI